MNKLTLFGTLFVFLLLCGIVNGEVYTLFNDTYENISFSFENSSQMHSFHITVNNTYVISASVVMEGSQLIGSDTKPADVILITDWSGSMKKDFLWGQGNEVHDCQAMSFNSSARKQSITRCVDKDFAMIIMNNSQNLLWLVFYKGLSGSSVDWYNTPDSLSQILQDIDAYNGQPKDKTCISCAINKAYDIFDQYGRDESAKFVLLMTDGTPTHCPQDGCNGNSSVYGQNICEGFCDTQGACDPYTQPGCNALDIVCEAAENSTLYSTDRLLEKFNATVFTVGFGNVGSCYRASALLSTIANKTGGAYQHSNDPNELRRIYKNISETILTSSFVSYPTPAINDPSMNTSLWYVNDSLIGSATWNQSNCGYSGAICADLQNVTQSLLDGCNLRTCRLDFYLNSSTIGTLFLSHLRIETQPRATIKCANPANKYLLTQGYPLPINIWDIFVANGSIGNVTQLRDDAWQVVLESPVDNMTYASTSANLSNLIVRVQIETDAGINSSVCEAIFTTNASDFGENFSIDCAPSMPSYAMMTGSVRNISVDRIFRLGQNIGIPNEITAKEENGVVFGSLLPEFITAQEHDLLGRKRSEVQVRTSLGLFSPMCPVEFTSVESACNREECRAYINDGDVESLIDECTNGAISVFNLNNGFRIYTVYRDLVGLDFQTTDFEIVQPDVGQFAISPRSGGYNTYYLINGTGVQSPDHGVGVIHLSFDQFDTVYCADLVRLNYYNGTMPLDITTDLLVTSSRSVAGYYDQNGRYVAQGPYVFTAKVWLRK